MKRNRMKKKYTINPGGYDNFMCVVGIALGFLKFLFIWCRFSILFLGGAQMRIHLDPTPMMQ